MAVYNDIVVTKNKDNNVDILNKHDLTTIKTIATYTGAINCSLMIDDYIYMGCIGRLYRVHINTYE